MGEAGETLADSLGSVITFVVFVTPWIVLLLLAAWLLRMLWRKRRARKALAAQAQS
jgi:chromate transport protein ChrA